ncbi:MAG: iron only hydrogenase large subunit [Clostridia bacterium]|jgi:iron only hydrogenase large subunit-like protein|nr:iron only hydrogenase large subunit [Clostridia bacterium]
MDTKDKSFYQERRLTVFRELVKSLWRDGSAKNVQQIEDELINRGLFEEAERNIIQDYIRIASGLSVESKEPIEEAVNHAMHQKGIEFPLVTVIKDVCDLCKHDKGSEPCRTSCHHGALTHHEERGVVIENGKCLTCGNCVSSCPFEALSDKVEFVPIIDMLKQQEVPVYAAIAPAYIGQFGENVTAGQIRSALKLIGFKDMIEVALFADLLTLREVFEFEHLVQKQDDYLITSCCCPIWMNMLLKGYPELLDKFSPAVSPMIAAGRVLKEVYKNSKVVFVGPCIAKKNEAKDKDLRDAIDYVLTFRELDEIFKALDIDLSKLPDEQHEQSSEGGRIYARTGGVSKAVEMSLKRLGHQGIALNAIQVDGVKECKEILDKLKNGIVEANFIEGMGCKGGCVGGPRANIDVSKATELVNQYGMDAPYQSPVENDKVGVILERIGIHFPSDILKGKSMQLFGRDLE